MRILIVSDAWKPQLNGVVRTYEDLCASLEAQGHETHVIGPADFPYRTPLPGYKEIELVIAAYGRLSRLIEEYKPDSIHIATEATLGMAARKYCRKRGIPFTTSYHTHFPDYVAKRVGRFMPFLYNPVKSLCVRNIRNFHNSAAGIMIATQSLEDELQSWNFTSPMHRLTRGVDMNIFKPGPATLFNDLPKPVALYVGRVAIEKNLEDFLEMEWEGSKIIVGDGPSMDELTRKYPDARFVGRKKGKELADHYRSSDLFVFPSRTDTFGIVLIEALACGLPVAGYNVTGPKDIITEPFLGALHDTDLGAASSKALASGGTKEQRFDFVKTHYTWDTASEQFLRAIELAEGRTASTG